MEDSPRRWRELSACCAAAMLRVSFSRGVVVTGASGAPVPRLLGEGRLKPSYQLNVVRNSSAESSVIARCGNETPL
jgi:hypothetical protein